MVRIHDPVRTHSRGRVVSYVVATTRVPEPRGPGNPLLAHRAPIARHVRAVASHDETEPVRPSGAPADDPAFGRSHLMIRLSFRAAVAATLFVVEASAQSGARQTEPRERSRHSQQEPRTPGQPSGETRPAKAAPSPTERARALLEQHPELRAKLFAKADADGDGKLSPAEREQMKQLVTTALAEARANAATRQDERSDQRVDRRDDRRDGRQDERTDQRVDRRDGRQDERSDQRVDRRDDRRDGRQDERSDQRVDRRDERRDGRQDERRGDEAEEFDIDESGRITPRSRTRSASDETTGTEPARPRERGNEPQRQRGSERGRNERK